MLKREGASSPGLRALRDLFNVVYFTSLKTEEGRSLQLRVALVDPNNEDPDRPPAPRPDRWTVTRLAARIPFTVPSLIKLSKAADPWSSCLATYYDSNGDFFVWGLVDQTVHFNTGLVHEKDFGYAPPGIFQVVATGTGDLSVYREHAFVARLEQDKLLQKQVDAFWSGPIHDRVAEGIGRQIESVWRAVKKTDLADIADEERQYGWWDPSIARSWVSTLCRLLISIQRYRHGGALLITGSRADLDIKYKIDYTRLREALVRMWVSRIQTGVARQVIHNDFLDRQRKNIPADLYLDQVISEFDEQDYRDEITGCVRFLASLSCVDGLVLATPDLSIRGFGVEILTKKELGAVYLSSTPKPTEKSLRKVDPNHYGTRHRSMMRYCFAHPKSVGFVISQDGEIRVMTRVRNRLIMWENLQVLGFIETKRSAMKQSQQKAATAASS